MKKILLILSLFLLCGCSNSEGNLLICNDNTIDEDNNMEVNVIYKFSFKGNKVNKLNEEIEFIYDNGNYDDIDLCSSFNVKSCSTEYDDKKIITKIEYDINKLDDYSEFNYISKDMNINQVKNALEKNNELKCEIE